MFQLVLVEAFNVLNGFLLSDHCKAKTINDIKTKQTISAHLCLVLSVCFLYQGSYRSGKTGKGQGI